MSEKDEGYPSLPLGRFLDLMASGEPAPGGGAAAAVAVCLAAALSNMAARLSAEHLTGAGELADRAQRLREQAEPLAQADAEAYGRFMAARRTGDESEERAALSQAVDVPLSIAEAGAEVAVISARLAEDGNPNLKGDATAAVLLAEAGVRSAAALVKINLQSADKEDDRLTRTEELLQTAAAARSAVEGGL